MPPLRPTGCAAACTEAALNIGGAKAPVHSLGKVDDMPLHESAQDSGLTVHTTRARRIPRDDLRERVLREGSAMLERTGVTASLHHVNMEELIRRVGVPRSSVFAAFGGKEELITELMIRLLQPGSGLPLGQSPTMTAMIDTLTQTHADRMRHADGSRDLTGEHAVLREMVRVVAAHNAEEMMLSKEWVTFMALSASVESLPEGRRERVIEALRDAEAGFTLEMAQFYENAFGPLGRRMRAGLGWQHLATAGASLVEGIVSRRRLGTPVAAETLMLPGLDDEPVAWTMVSVAYLAMVENLTEPVPL